MQKQVMWIGCATLALVGLLALPVSACPSSSNDGYFKFPMFPVDRIVTAHGLRTHPMTGAEEFHYGIDIAGKRGDAVSAVEGGRIMLAEHTGKLGSTVLIAHGGGWATNYAHLGSMKVRLGDCIAAGDLIGTVGSSGLSDQPLLHFEILKDGVSIDPLRCAIGGDDNGGQAVCRSEDVR